MTLLLNCSLPRDSMSQLTPSALSNSSGAIHPALLSSHRAIGGRSISQARIGACLAGVWAMGDDFGLYSPARFGPAFLCDLVAQTRRSSRRASHQGASMLSATKFSVAAGTYQCW